LVLGNYLRKFSPDYFTSNARNAWGDAPDFSEPPMRRYVVDNAAIGCQSSDSTALRLDAVQTVADDSPRHVVREMADRVSTKEPHPVLVAEDDRQRSRDDLGSLGSTPFGATTFTRVRVALTGEPTGIPRATHASARRHCAIPIEGGWLYRVKSSLATRARLLGAYPVCHLANDVTGRIVGHGHGHGVQAQAVESEL